MSIALKSNDRNLLLELNDPKYWQILTDWLLMALHRVQKFPLPPQNDSELTPNSIQIKWFPELNMCVCVRVEICN
jgi:hypothetical protein